MEGILNIVHRNGAVVKSKGQVYVSTEQNNTPKVLISHFFESRCTSRPSTDQGSKSLVNKCLC